MATRGIVVVLARAFPHLTFVHLSDFNPFGFAIMLNYRYPSIHGSFEAKGLHVERVKSATFTSLLGYLPMRCRWLGMRAGHVREIMRESPGTLHLQPYSTADHDKINSLVQYLLNCDRFSDEVTLVVILVMYLYVDMTIRSIDVDCSTK